jgi:Fe2+ transport system protein FeoA
MPLDQTDYLPTLATLGHGDRATVLHVDPGDHELHARLAARGLVPGARIAVLRAGDPLLLRIEKTKWAINRRDASHITVDVERRRRSSLLERLRGV